MSSDLDIHDLADFLGREPFHRQEEEGLARQRGNGLDAVNRFVFRGVEIEDGVNIVKRVPHSQE